MSGQTGCPCEGGTLDRLIQPAILVVLAQGPLHGYRLAERISEIPGLVRQKPDVSGVYRFLGLMERKELVVASWDVSSSGPARKSYQITPAGRKDGVKQSRSTEEMMVRVLPETDRSPPQELAKEHRISDQAIYVWCVPRETSVRPQLIPCRHLASRAYG